MEVHPGVHFEPGLHHRVLVGGVVVQNEVEVDEPLRDCCRVRWGTFFRGRRRDGWRRCLVGIRRAKQFELPPRVPSKPWMSARYDRRSTARMRADGTEGIASVPRIRYSLLPRAW